MQRIRKSGDGMRAKQGMTATALAVVLALSGCGAEPDSDRTNLMRLRSKDGPDEFAILPPKALELPTNLGELPQPTPGGGNRTDQRPLDDAIVALGGKPGAAGGIPAADSALYAHASRLGLQQNIRGQLASEDLQWRRDNKGRILERVFAVNSYYRAYRDQSLDQTKELEYWRKRGLLTPSAPPPGYKEDK